MIQKFLARRSQNSEQSAHVIEHSSVPFVRPHMWAVAKRLIGSGCRLGWWVGSGSVWVYWILVVIVEGEGAVWGVNMWRPIVTNGDFVVSLCGSAYSDRAVVWRDEWSGPRHSCVKWKSTCLKGKGLFLAWFLAFSAFSSNTLQWRHTDTLTYWSMIDSCVKSWQYFRTQNVL